MEKQLTRLKQVYLSVVLKGKLSFQKAQGIVNAFFLLMSMVSLGFVVYEFGYINTNPALEKLRYFYLPVLFLYFIRFVYRSFFSQQKKQFSKRYFLVNIAVSFVLFILLYNHLVSPKHQILFSIFEHPLIIYFFVAVFAGLDVSVFVVTILRKTFNLSQLFAFSFFLIICIGSGMLMLPNASLHGIHFADAVFVSTSAVCVTGLTPIDVGRELTFFGQLILLGLIQIGGLGVMTFTSFIGVFFMQKPSYENQYVIKGLLNQDNYIDISTTLRNIVFTTFGIEILGAFLIYQSIDGNSIHDFWISIFHSISAFCNAGFSTFSGNLFDVQVRANYLMYFWVACLIIVGGLGFPIIFNYARYLFYKIRNAFFILFRKQEHIVYLPRIINLSTKIVLVTTGILLLAGTVFFFIFEYNNTMKGLNIGEKLMDSFFFSTSARTAGFNNLPMGNIMPASALVLMFLMWIGASPSSTGGGIKTTTFAIAFLNIVNVIKGKERMEISKRQVATHSIQRAFVIITISILLITSITILLSLLEPKVSLTRLLVEVFSAFGTVGFSMDLTPHLSIASKYIIAATMFIGRIGMITFLLIFAGKYKVRHYAYPEENILLT